MQEDAQNSSFDIQVKDPIKHGENSLSVSVCLPTFCFERWMMITSLTRPCRPMYRIKFAPKLPCSNTSSARARSCGASKTLPGFDISCRSRIEVSHLHAKAQSCHPSMMGVLSQAADWHPTCNGLRCTHLLSVGCSLWAG